MDEPLMTLHLRRSTLMVVCVLLFGAACFVGGWQTTHPEDQIGVVAVGGCIVAGLSFAALMILLIGGPDET